MADKSKPHVKLDPPKWLGRPIADARDSNDLERSAAAYEFVHGKKREEAEQMAHTKYRKQYHEQAAGHHLRGMKTAQAAGEPEHAKKHRLLYDLHMKALNLDPMDAVPAHIKAHSEQESGQRHSFYRFKPHRGDVFLFEDKA